MAKLSVERGVFAAVAVAVEMRPFRLSASFNDEATSCRCRSDAGSSEFWQRQGLASWCPTWSYWWCSARTAPATVLSVSKPSNAEGLGHLHRDACLRTEARPGLRLRFTEFASCDAAFVRPAEIDVVVIPSR